MNALPETPDFSLLLTPSRQGRGNKKGASFPEIALTQYLLAVDRSNERVAKLYDSLHPAVLAAIRQVVERTHRAGKPVSVCGEMAGDPAGALLLMGMGLGVDSLSMSPGNLLKIKWVIRSFTLSQARELLAESLQMDNATLVRQRLNAVLEQQGLGSLVRAGNRESRP